MIDNFFGISAPDWSSMIRNYVTAGALIVGAYVALKGLHTWKQQLDLNDNRGLSKSIASYIYHIRTIHNDVREGMYSDRAYLNNSNGTPSKNYNNPNVREEYQILREKLIAAEDVKSKLYPLLLEAELLWGDELITRTEEYFTELSKIQHSLFQREVKRNRSFRDDASWETQWDEIEAIENEIFLYSRSKKSQDLTDLLQLKFDRIAGYLRSKMETAPS